MFRDIYLVGRRDEYVRSVEDAIWYVERDVCVHLLRRERCVCVESLWLIMSLVGIPGAVCVKDQT